ncbi:MAG: DUF2339 domain-containing protein [Bacteroidia bacterium]
MADDWKILNDKLNLLIREQERFQTEIKSLKSQIDKLKPKEEVLPVIAVFDSNDPIVRSEPIAQLKLETIPVAQVPSSNKSNKPSSDLNKKWEKFIGENLISKIGIVILILGVAIGAKFAIDHDLISPLTRIILGYTMGFGLLAFAFKLKVKYEQFSAVLLSGSMAINYFLTYAAYSLYNLFPQELAFLLMVIFTVFTVLASLTYNLQLIAHIGLIGAYAVPFLLSNGSGKVAILFSYMAIINLGILFIAYKRFWKLLYHVAFVLTWLIYASWFVFSYQQENHQWLALGFASLYFITFYGMFLVYKLIENEKFEPKHVLLIVSNSFIYFGFGYQILDSHYSTNDFLGLFTAVNGLIHFIVSYQIQKRDLADKNLFVMLMGMVLVFISIAIPIQLDGNWVTLSWAAEATLLFYIGRSRRVAIYEWLSYAVMILFAFSILQDWRTMLNEIKLGQSLVSLVMNTYFMVGFLASIAFGFINYFHSKFEFDSVQTKEYKQLRNIFLPALFVMVSFGCIAMEIVNYWNTIMYNYLVHHNEFLYDSIMNPMIDAVRFKNIWLINFAAFYCLIVSRMAVKMELKATYHYVIPVLNALVIFLFLMVSLFEFSELREAYLLRFTPSTHIYFPYSLAIRYISFVFIVPLVYYTNKLSKSDFIPQAFHWIGDLFKHLFILWLASSEMLHVMDMIHMEGSYKLSLSILWGIYALILVFIGINHAHKHLRYAAISLFTFTLLKLFFYDISGLNTIGKTIVFVSLGILLLLISFLYNKNKSNLFDDEKEA